MLSWDSGGIYQTETIALGSYSECFSMREYSLRNKPILLRNERSDYLCFEVAQLTEIGEFVPEIAVEEQLVESGEA